MSNALNMYYDLTVAGRKLTPEQLALVSAVNYKDTSTGSDILTINITDPDYQFIGSESIFIEDNAIDFTGGWKGKTPIKFKGYISVIDIDFPNDGSPTLIINCMDNTYKMNRKSLKRTWENKKESYVVDKIFKEYGFKSHVDTTSTVEKTISQSNKTDIEFILELAEKQDEKFIVYVEGNDAYFKKKPTISTAQTTLWYKGATQDIQSFNPRVNREKKKEEVDKSDVDMTAKKKVQAKTSTSRSTQGKTVKTSSKKVTDPTQGKFKIGDSRPALKYNKGGVWSNPAGYGGGFSGGTSSGGGGKGGGGAFGPTKKKGGGGNAMVSHFHMIQ